MAEYWMKGWSTAQTGARLQHRLESRRGNGLSRLAYGNLRQFHIPTQLPEIDRRRPLSF